ncbi:MAG TPA: GNAT family N-acetyltransferase [Candidatus Dormibacteraeota bacterium]
MSIQLEVLADEVFDAAAAQARLGSHSTRHPFGEVIRHPEYPDLFFLNVIARLVAPSWSIEDVNRAVDELLPGPKQIRIDSRDPATVANLRFLTEAGYRHDVRVAMVHVFADPFPSPGTGGGSGRGFSVAEVAGDLPWADFEESLRTDAREHEWSQPMTDQYLRLCRWRAENTPHRYYLLYEDDRRLSHAGLFQHGRTVYLHGVYTRPDARRRGAGGALTQAMATEAHRLGGDRLVLQTDEDGHLPAFYARLGYRPVGQQHTWTKTR